MMQEVVTLARAESESEIPAEKVKNRKDNRRNFFTQTRPKRPRITFIVFAILSLALVRLTT